MQPLKLNTIANAVNVWHTDKEKFSQYWKERLEDEEKKMPSGSGIDSGCEVNKDLSTAKRIVIDVPYHHMDEYGGYCGWNYYRLKLYPSFLFGTEIKVTMYQKNAECSRFDINITKEYLADLFSELIL